MNLRKPNIDWKSTKRKLKLLRLRNEELSKSVCFHLHNINSSLLSDTASSLECTGSACSHCENYCEYITREALGSLLGYSVETIKKYEDDKFDSGVPLSALLLYSEYSKTPLEKIITVNDYYYSLVQSKEAKR